MRLTRNTLTTGGVDWRYDGMFEFESTAEELAMNPKLEFMRFEPINWHFDERFPIP
jgi:hypothetical protein